MMIELLNNNRNVFRLSTEYSNTSFVWTYNENAIYIFKLINGKVQSEKKYQVENDAEWICQNLNNNFIGHIFDCNELDGDVLEFRVIENGEIKKHSFPIDVECFIKTSYESKFLSKLSEDIKKYSIKL